MAAASPADEPLRADAIGEALQPGPAVDQGPVIALTARQTALGPVPTPAGLVESTHLLGGVGGEVPDPGRAEVVRARGHVILRIEGEVTADVGADRARPVTLDHHPGTPALPTPHDVAELDCAVVE